MLGEVAYKNFRPQGPLFLVEIEFVVGGVGWGGVNSNNLVKPSPRLRLVELWLGWGFPFKTEMTLINKKNISSAINCVVQKVIINVNYSTYYT